MANWGVGALGRGALHPPGLRVGVIVDQLDLVLGHPHVILGIYPTRAEPHSACHTLGGGQTTALELVDAAQDHLVDDQPLG